MFIASISQSESLSYFFTVLDCSRPGCEHPDYHTLLGTLMQILQGIVLNAWKAECGHTSLVAFAASNPTPDSRGIIIIKREFGRRSIGMS